MSWIYDELTPILGVAFSTLLAAVIAGVIATTPLDDSSKPPKPAGYVTITQRKEDKLEDVIRYGIHVSKLISRDIQFVNLETVDLVISYQQKDTVEIVLERVRVHKKAGPQPGNHNRLGD